MPARPSDCSIVRSGISSKAYFSLESSQTSMPDGFQNNNLLCTTVGRTTNEPPMSICTALLSIVRYDHDPLHAGAYNRLCTLSDQTDGSTRQSSTSADRRLRLLRLAYFAPSTTQDWLAFSPLSLLSLIGLTWPNPSDSNL